MYLGDSPAFERFTDRALAKSLLVAYLRDDDSARVGRFSAVRSLGGLPPAA